MLPVAALVQADILEGLSPEERETFVGLLRKATAAGNEHSRSPLVTPEPARVTGPRKA